MKVYVSEDERYPDFSLSLEDSRWKEFSLEMSNEEYENNQKIISEYNKLQKLLYDYREKLYDEED